MKKLILVLVFILSTGIVYAVDIPTYDSRTETTYDTYQSNQSYRYEQRQSNPYGSEPLGGYSEFLGNAGTSDRNSPYYDGDGYGASDDVGYGY